MLVRNPWTRVAGQLAKEGVARQGLNVANGLKSKMGSEILLWPRPSDLSKGRTAMGQPVVGRLGWETSLPNKRRSTVSPAVNLKWE